MNPLADWRVAAEPFYAPQGGEIELFEAACAARLPVMLKGPTGCGKSRFVEHMAWKLPSLPRWCRWLVRRVDSRAMVSTRAFRRAWWSMPPR